MTATQNTDMQTSRETVDRFLEELDQSKQTFAATTVGERISLLEGCAEGLVTIAPEWVESACRAKEISAGSPHRAEEVFVGPVAALRYIRLLVHSLREIETSGIPRLPGNAYQASDGRLRVPLLPTGVLYDRLALFPFKATAWMRDGLRQQDLRDCLATHYRTAGHRSAKTIVVLGAGNVSAIPLTDTLTKLFQEGGVVLLKMSPVNEYLGPLFEQALKPLIDPGYLRIIYGGVDVGSIAVNHPLADEVHITGSIHSHDLIVWGLPGSERDRRISTGTPLLTKPVTSELGSVSPWIVFPGEYSRKQLEFQAENVATSIINNVSFNCVATKVLITWKHWPQRSRFLDLIDALFARTPPRFSYYPGAIDRYRRFAQVDSAIDLDENLPWTLLRDVKPDEQVHHFSEESFVCVLAEVGLDAPTPEAFLQQAVDFANEHLWGTLCAAITVPDRFRSRPSDEQRLQRALGELRYGAVAINHWPALMYAMMSPPWGGFPGSTIADAQSGIGYVHNTFMLEGVEKTVLEGPLTIWPKPPWFASHLRAERVAWSYLQLYHKPSWMSATRWLLTLIGP